MPSAPVRRVAELAGEVIDSFANDRVPDARASAERLYGLLHEDGGVALLRAGVPKPELAALQARADALRGLLSPPGRALAAGQAANRVLEVLGRLAALHSGSSLPQLIRLSYLEREIELRSAAGQFNATHAAVRGLRGAWDGVRSRVVAAGGHDLADRFERHIAALERSDGPAAVRREAPIGRAAIVEMELLLGDAGATGESKRHAQPTLDSAGAWHPVFGAAR